MASAAVTAGNTGWSWSNPLPQGNDLSTVASAGGTAWAGGSIGTLTRSETGGALWDATRTGLLDDVRVVRPISNSSVVFASRCALRRTDDAGATVRRLQWGSSDDVCAAEIASVHFPSSLIGYLLLANGDVMTTSDGGNGWVKRGAIPGALSLGGTDVPHDIWFSSDAMGVVSSGPKVFHTADAGATWTPVKTVTGTGRFTFDFVSATHGFAIGDRTDLLTTTDGGANWSTVTSDFYTNARTFNSLACASTTICVAIDTDGVLARTTDGGATWKKAGAAPAGLASATFLDPTHVVGVGKGGLTAYSGDAGETWTQAGSAALGTYREVRARTSKHALMFGDSGAVARTLNGGANWSRLADPGTQTVVDASFVSVSRGWVLDAGANLSTTSSGGLSWQKLGAVKGARAVYASGGKAVLLFGTRGVQRSTNFGKTFKRASNASARKRLTDYDVAGKAIFAFGPKSLAVSTNVGKSWKAVRTPRGAGSIAMLDMTSAKRGFAVDSSAELWSTTNGGKKWSRVETTGANLVSSMSFADRLHGYISDATGRVLATADGGKSWSRQYPFYDAAAASPLRVAAMSGRNAFLLVAGTNHVFTTNTGGTVGAPSKLTIASSTTRATKGSIVKITGRLTPAVGGERVTVLARTLGAKNGTAWAAQERSVSLNGTFVTSWRVTKPTIFIARWTGDAAHDGDAALAVTVRLR
jgi:photosystem II stability/assembly factor-like uncharacterized protein